MKTTTLTIAILLFLNIANAQESYIPLKKAKNSTLSVSIDLPADLKTFQDYLKENPNIIGLKVNARSAPTSNLYACLNLVKSLTELNTLEIFYHSDSLNLEQLSELTNINTLRLFASSDNYQNLSSLGKLQNLESLGLNKISADRLPEYFFMNPNFNEIEILQDTINETQATEKIMIYKRNGNEKRIFVTSYNPNCDLYTDSVTNILLAKISGATNYIPKSGGNRNQFATQYPASYYKVPRSFKPIPNGNLTNNTQIINIDPQVDNSIELKDESILTIPANSLVDIKGSIVKGNVDILYRTINTPSDIMTTGIPMTFDTAGKSEFFKSKGMFEIRAFSGENVLQVRNGSQLNLNYITKQDSSNFNLYNIGPDGAWRSNSFSLTSINNFRSYCTMTDKTTFEERYRSKDYYYLVPNAVASTDVKWNLSRNQRKKNFFGTISGKYKYIKKGKNLIKLKTQLDVSDTANKKLFVTLDLENYSSKYENTIRRLFPELVVFDGFKFELESYMRPLKFKDLYKKNKKYNDIRIYYEPGDQFGTIELKHQNGFVELTFKTTLKDKKGNLRISKYFLRKYRKYLQLLKEREKIFNELSTKVHYTTATYSREIYTYKTGFTKDKNIQYSINFDLLGFFNCDQLYRINNPLTINNAIFLDEADNQISCNTIYITDKEAGGSYSFPSNKFIVSEKNCSGIIAVSNDSKVYYINGDDLRANNYLKRFVNVSIKLKEAKEEPIDQLCKRESIE